MNFVLIIKSERVVLGGKLHFIAMFYRNLLFLCLSSVKQTLK